MLNTLLINKQEQGTSFEVLNISMMSALPLHSPLCLFEISIFLRLIPES